MDRASTFSDPGIIHRLQTEFIPVAGNTAELQRRRSAAARWFTLMANQNDWRSQPGDTMQGFYVASPDGTSYGWLNDRNIDRLNALLDTALREYRRDPPVGGAASQEAGSPQ